MSRFLQKPEKIYLHKNDLPTWVMESLKSLKVRQVSIDTEAMGLCYVRDRLCLVQMCFDGGECHLVKFSANDPTISPNMISILEDPTFLKIFHFARFDVAILYQTFGVLTKNIYCTKIASKLARTYTDRHGLKSICQELLQIDISKKEQCSDWGRDVITEEQKNYASNDVLYLHHLKDKLDEMLIRENRQDLAYECFKFLPYLAQLDCNGWNETLFSHH